MAHNTRVRNDPQWSIGLPWTTAEIQALDQSLQSAVNGDGGGTYSPAETIVIGGKGIRLVSVPHGISGAQSKILTTAGTAPLVHNDSDYCLLGEGHAGRTLATRSPVGLAVWSSGFQLAGANVFNISAIPIVGTALGASARVPLRVHDGATLSQAEFSFVVAYPVGGPTVVPTQPPRFGVFAEDMFGNKTPLSLAAPYQSIPTPPDPFAWQVKVAQSATFTCDSPNKNPAVIIDRSKFSYFGAIIEVSGAGAVVGNVYYGDVTSTFTGITDTRPR